MYTFLVIASLSATIIWLWVQGIDKMNKEHPDYKGEDFFDEQ
jgi:hypothetical protein